MPSIYRCTCGTAYNLEEGKKYKCKKCGAIMSLAASPATSPTPAPPSARPTPAAGSGSTLRKPGASASARASARAGANGRTERGEAPAKKGMSTGVKAAIGIGVGALVIAILAMDSGMTDTAAAEAARIAAIKARAAEAAARTEEAEKPPPPPRKLAKAEVDETIAKIKKAQQGRDLQALYAILDQVKNENWEFDRDPLYYAILTIDPHDPRVIGSLGDFDRKKKVYDIVKEKTVAALASADKRAGLYDALNWVFENKCDTEIDWLFLIYKKLRDNCADDYEAKVAWYDRGEKSGSEPYTGPIQEYKGKKLKKDEFEDVKRLEWKLHKETGAPFLPTKGGGSQAK